MYVCSWTISCRKLFQTKASICSFKQVKHHPCVVLSKRLGFWHLMFVYLLNLCPPLPYHNVIDILGVLVFVVVFNFCICSCNGLVFVLVFIHICFLVAYFWHIWWTNRDTVENNVVPWIFSARATIVCSSKYNTFVSWSIWKYCQKRWEKVS